ncbi:MAG: OB-fold nucleic acid binding domain-containing protein [Actinomycetes bacterium]
MLDRWTASLDDVHAAEEQERSSKLGATPCRMLHDRERVCLAGSLRSVTLRPRAGVPALEAELFDGSGTVTVIWLGRREIAGISAGRRIKVEGLVAVRDGEAVMYNPKYELLTGQPG